MPNPGRPVVGHAPHSDQRLGRRRWVEHPTPRAGMPCPWGLHPMPRRRHRWVGSTDDGDGPAGGAVSVADSDQLDVIREAIARHDWQTALDTAQAVASTTRHGKPTAPTSKPKRRGGWAGCRTASPLASTRTTCTTSSTTSGVPVSPRCGSGSTTRSTPGRPSRAAGCAAPAERSRTIRSAWSTAACCCERPRRPTAVASSRWPRSWPPRRWRSGACSDPRTWRQRRSRRRDAS